MLTIADPFVVQMAGAFRKSSGAGFTICVLSRADVTDAFTAKRYEDLGADRVMLHQNANCDFSALWQIVENFSCELELYVNTRSLYKCPYRQDHRAYISHLSTLPTEDLEKPNNRNWFKGNCIAIRQKNPLEILLAPTIRPEGLWILRRVGIRLLKISARTMPTEWVVKVSSAYVNRSFDGNIADLCDTNLGREMPFIDNKKLDGFIARIKDDCINYDSVCREYCSPILST